MSEDPMLKYHIDQTNQRLERIEAKLDDYLLTKGRLLGIAAIISILISALTQGLVQFISAKADLSLKTESISRRPTLPKNP